MKYSTEALKILAAREEDLFHTCKQFWDQFPRVDDLNRKLPYELPELEARMQTKLKNMEEQGLDGFICAFDPEFPRVSAKVTKGAKPYLLFYKGDIALLKADAKVAVIGETDPTDEIKTREETLVRYLVDQGSVIVSGLAIGCDSISHRTCMEAGGKTVAILPSTIKKIIPAENRELAEKILETGGLLLTEYEKEPASSFEQTARYVDRDRLQAIFSNAVLLIASYRKGEGDSGSRHAMEAAQKYGIACFAMYKEQKDADDVHFGLNQDLINKKSVPVATKNALQESIGLKELSLF